MKEDIKIKVCCMILVFFASIGMSVSGLLACNIPIDSDILISGVIGSATYFVFSYCAIFK